MDFDRPTPRESRDVPGFIAAEQGRQDRNIVYVGDEPDGVRAELEVLTPDWTSTVRVARDADGTVAGAALVEWDEDVGRAWVFGPWEAGDDDAWARLARPLFDIVAEQIPDGITSRELAGSIDNGVLAALASEVGWHPTETNYAYALDRDVAAGWATDERRDDLRLAEDRDLDAITTLHDLEFPATYFTASQLLERANCGEQVVLVADGSGGAVAGYAAGKVQPDGDGYIDFVAVEPTARGGGIGRRLVIALGRRLLAASTGSRVHLTVQEHRAPARALYSALGFRDDAAFRGYRSDNPT